MSKSVYRNFRRTYGVDLLPKATANYQLGNKVEWDFGKLDVELYPFVEELGLDNTLEKSITKKLAEEKLVKAQFAETEISASALMKIGGYIPNINLGIKSGLKFDKITSLKFTGIKAKQINGELRSEINKALRKYELNDPKGFKKRLAKDKVFESLFYAEKVELSVKNMIEKDSLAEFKMWNVDFEGHVESYNDSKIVLKGSTEIPFAANIKSLKDFID